MRTAVSQQKAERGEPGGGWVAITKPATRNGLPSVPRAPVEAGRAAAGRFEIRRVGVPDADLQRKALLEKSRSTRTAQGAFRPEHLQQALQQGVDGSSARRHRGQESSGHEQIHHRRTALIETRAARSSWCRPAVVANSCPIDVLSSRHSHACAGEEIG